MKNFPIFPKHWLLLFSLVIISSCSDDNGPDEPVPGPRTAQDVIDDFNSLTINEGINDLELESLVSGVFWSFRLIVPEGASGSNKRPLVVNLHGAAQASSPNAHKSTDCLVEPAFEGKNVFILSPNSSGRLWYDQANQVQVQALVELVSDNMDVDTDRTVVTGYSDGGNGSWFYAQYFPGLFDAAIPLASSWRATDNSGQVGMIDIPLYVIHGTDDELFPFETTEEYVEEYIAAGSDITFVAAEGLIHIEPCTYVDYMKDAVTWLEVGAWK